MHGLIFEISISRLAGSTRYPFPPFTRARPAMRAAHPCACSFERLRGRKQFQNPDRFTGTSANRPLFWQSERHQPRTPAYEQAPPEQPHALPREQRRRLRGAMSVPHRPNHATAWKIQPNAVENQPNHGGKWFQCDRVDSDSVSRC